MELHHANEYIPPIYDERFEANLKKNVARPKDNDIKDISDKKIINDMDDLDKLQEASWASTVKVYINISFTKLLDIDTINQRFQAEAIIEAKWVDPNIKSVQDVLDEKKMWKPDLYIENGIKDVKEEVTYQIVPIPKNLLPKIEQYDANGEENLMICEMRKVTGIFYENLELQNFPLDVQDLTIYVVTKKPGNIVKFKPMCAKKEGIKINSMLDKSMWKTHHVLLMNEDSVCRDFSYGRREYPGIKSSIKVFRQPGFFFWNALLPFMLVTFASLAPFVNNIRTNVSNRLPATCTLILTSVGTRFTIGRLLPTVSYLTSLDKYSLATMLIITVELLYHAIMGACFSYIERNFGESTGFNIDKGAFLFFFCLMIFQQILFAIWVFKAKRYRKEVHDGKIDILNEEMSEISANGRKKSLAKKGKNDLESEKMLKDNELNFVRV